MSKIFSSALIDAFAELHANANNLSKEDYEIFTILLQRQNAIEDKFEYLVHNHENLDVNQVDEFIELKNTLEEIYDKRIQYFDKERVQNIIEHMSSRENLPIRGILWLETLKRSQESNHINR